MTIIRFLDETTERQAFGFLTGRFSFKSWASGETMVPEAALPALAQEGIRFIVEGSAGYERLASLRDTARPWSDMVMPRLFSLRPAGTRDFQNKRLIPLSAATRYASAMVG